MRKYKIATRFAEQVLCPANAIEADFYRRQPQDEFHL